MIGKAEVECPECASVQGVKVLSMNAGFTRITWAECLVCALQFTPRAPDQGKHADSEIKVTPTERPSR